MNPNTVGGLLFLGAMLLIIPLAIWATIQMQRDYRRRFEQQARKLARSFHEGSAKATSPAKGAKDGLPGS
jgi:hypothetical protein